MKNLPSDNTPAEIDIAEQDLGEDVMQSNADNNGGKTSYGQILKSSFLIGGSTVIVILIGIIRTKFMAILLGPSGVGLMGIYNSIIELTQSVVGIGINSSGVRQIAKAAGANNELLVAKTAQVLRRTSIFLGILGALFIFGFSSELSLLTFSNEQQSEGIALLSLAVFCNLVSAGQSALIQAMRRITDLAKMGILAAIYGTIISIPAVYFFGLNGVAPALVLISLMALLTSWWYRRKIKLNYCTITKSEIQEEQLALLKLGFAFMAGSLMMTGTSYLVRMIIVRETGFAAAGLYQAAWTLGGMYVGIILQAMGTDFYPRLTAIADNNPECNRIVNEQTHISLLMAGPGIIATLTLTPLVVELFYSAKFQAAADLLRWLCLGMILRVVSWPMGFIIMAKGAQNQLIISELAWGSIYLIFCVLGIQYFSLTGVGMAFFGSYAVHILINFIIVKKLSGFKFLTANLKLTLLFLAVMALVFYNFYAFNFVSAIAIGLFVTLLVSFYAVFEVLTLIPLDKIPNLGVKVLKLLRILDITRSSQNLIQSGDDISTTALLSANRKLTKIKQALITFILVNFFIIVIDRFMNIYLSDGAFDRLDTIVNNLSRLNFDFIRRWAGI